MRMELVGTRSCVIRRGTSKKNVDLECQRIKLPCLGVCRGNKKEASRRSTPVARERNPTSHTHGHAESAPLEAYATLLR
jgi:hypothetical protein